MQREYIHLKGQEVLDKIRDLIEEGNARRVIVKVNNKVLLNLPLSIIAAGALLSPVIAGAGFVLAIIKDCTIEIHK